MKWHSNNMFTEINFGASPLSSAGQRIMSKVCFLILIFLSNAVFAADLEVTVKGFRVNQGLLRLAIFSDPKEFPRGTDFRNLNVRVKSVEAVAIFRDMPSGVFAIAIHHDENLNKEMDTNFIGLPKEGYGFSNNAKIFLGPPNFEAASFKIGSKHKKIRMNIVY